MPLESLTVGIQFQASAKSTDGSRKREDKLARNQTDQYVIGTGEKAANKEWHDKRTLNNTTENLDLSGALANGLAEAQVFTKVRVFYARNLSAAGTVTFDTEVANGATTLFKSFTLGPGEEVVFNWKSATGKAITAATADLVRVTTNANVEYEIGVAGE